MEINQTAILIFARDVREEIHGKLLFGSNQAKNIRLFNTLNQKIKETAAATGLPSFLISTKEQHGFDFSERYKTQFNRFSIKVLRRSLLLEMIVLPSL